MPAKIFVQIASYCDAEFESTVRDLFGKANDPCNVRVGACVQSPGGMRPHLSGLSGKKIDLIVVDAADSCGTVWSRGNAQSLWAGEDYVLQIDSHVRFAPHWDALLMS